MRRRQSSSVSPAANSICRCAIRLSVCFYTPPGPFTQLVADAVQDAFGLTPEFATTGGTSDARYIRNYCPVVELGLRNETAHMIDEHCAVEDVRTLARCYEAILRRYFA